MGGVSQEWIATWVVIKLQAWFLLALLLPVLPCDLSLHMPLPVLLLCHVVTQPKGLSPNGSIMVSGLCSHQKCMLNKPLFPIALSLGYFVIKTHNRLRPEDVLFLL